MAKKQAFQPHDDDRTGGSGAVLYSNPKQIPIYHHNNFSHIHVQVTSYYIHDTENGNI